MMNTVVAKLFLNYMQYGFHQCAHTYECYNSNFTSTIYPLNMNVNKRYKHWAQSAYDRKVEHNCCTSYRGKYSLLMRQTIFMMM